MSSSTSPLASAVPSQQDSTPPAMPAPQVDPQTVATGLGQPSTQAPVLAKQPSRLMSTLAAIVGAGVAGIPSQGRPSFVTGLGQGARAEQADIANQQAIKFKNFDDQVRAANLHNQDLELQLRTQEQQDAHQKAQDFQRDYDNENGITYNPHPNDGTAVMQTLQGQTQAQGAASIPAGTHLSADGDTINIPSNDPNTQAGLLKKYQDLQGVLPFLSTLPQGAQFVPPKYQDQLTHIMAGYDVHGDVLTHDQLKNLIPALQSQRDAAAKNDATPYQLGTLDNLISIYKANENNHQDAEDQAYAQQTKQKAAQAKAVAEATLPTKEALQDNAAANKNQGASTQPDPFGVPSTLDAKTANKRYDTFSKAYVQPLTKTDQQLSQFANIQSDIDKTGNMTGAESVVGLFNAIGISASPLKGMGFRINNNTVEEHANARGLGQSLYQKLLGLKSGDVVTPQQLKDYASIATQARESQYFSAIDEARRQGLPVDFLPKGGGAQIDPSTAKMYMRAANNDPNNARAAAQQAGWKF